MRWVFQRVAEHIRKASGGRQGRARVITSDLDAILSVRLLPVSSRA